MGCYPDLYNYLLGDYAQLMSDTAEFVITTAQNWKVLSQATVEEIVGRVTQLLTEIRDPKSGEQAEVTQAPLPDGLKIVVRGSESVRAEARRRMSTMSF
jgi:vancomycin resistance protein YoaR